MSTICSSGIEYCCVVLVFCTLIYMNALAFALLDLSSDFGIKEMRGTLLRASFSHQDIADLVGASRPRVTETLARLEREHLIVRQGRNLIVRVEQIGDAIAVPPSRARELGSSANSPSKSFREKTSFVATAIKQAQACDFRVSPRRWVDTKRPSPSMPLPVRGCAE
jgi:DNA-binding transcriptional MocR family regulator